MNIDEKTIQDLLNIAKSLKFGEIVIKIQDSNIVHIEKKERFRIGKVADPSNREAR